jgi:hypothetical protein
MHVSLLTCRAVNIYSESGATDEYHELLECAQALALLLPEPQQEQALAEIRVLTCLVHENVNVTEEIMMFKRVGVRLDSMVKMLGADWCVRVNVCIHVC